MDIFYPIKRFADWLTYAVFSIQRETIFADAVNFFIFDSIKIFLLLIVIIFGISLIRSFIPAARVRRILSHRYQITGNFLAAAFGIITPFCTCSAIPLFLGFIEAGVPIGVTFSFLISSPMINEIAIVLLFGLFGLKIALMYIVSGYLIAVVSGVIIGKFNFDHLIIKTFENKTDNSQNIFRPSWTQRLNNSKNYTLGVLSRVWPYILIGIGIGAWIHGYVPTEIIVRYAGGKLWYTVPLATLIGIPLYSNAAGIIPLVSVLTKKGVAIGTTLAFMMAVTALSLPEFLILKKIMKIKLIVVFAFIVWIGILFTGYLFNFLLT
jgi:uncharacterized protein